MTTETSTAPSTNVFVDFLKRRWLVIVLNAVAAVIAIQNAVSDEAATVLLLWTQITLPSWLLIVIVFVIGAITGWLASRGRSRRRKR